MTAVTDVSHAASNKPRFIVCEGNEAAAIGVALSRPDVVAVYPITPQSSLVEHLSQMIADGRLKADLMNVEGEHAVMCGLQGVALAGGRTFTATCGPGLAFMFEPYVRTPGMRLPMVASLVAEADRVPRIVNCFERGRRVADSGHAHASFSPPIKAAMIALVCGSPVFENKPSPEAATAVSAASAPNWVAER